jgi:hypothetical protein
MNRSRRKSTLKRSGSVIAPGIKAELKVAIIGPSCGVLLAIVCTASNDPAPGLFFTTKAGAPAR